MAITQQSTFIDLYPRFYRDYENMTDEQTVLQAQHGHRKSLEYILNEYRKMVIKIIKQNDYFFRGAEMADVIQEGMIGLFKATIDFKKGSFHNFAELCITRQIISGIKTATRQKNLPLNQRTNIEELICQPYATDADPEENFIRTETMELFTEELEKVISPFEFQVLQTYPKKRTYKETAKSLDCKTKSIDNALSRIRGKSIHLAHCFQK